MRKFDEQNFLKTYRGTETFITEEKKYYDAFLKLLENEALLQHIKFSNDELHIPPIRTFIAYERNHGSALFDEKMSSVAKRGLGACFGYLYRFMYDNEKYESEQTWFNDEKTGIKTASFFKKI